MKVDLTYYRHVLPGFSELVKTVVLEFKNKTQMMKHSRETKKKIAEECKYNLVRDNVYYIVTNL